MSIKLSDRYPGRFNNPTAGYPQGSFKNRTSPVAKDGSYLEKDWANDKEGFFQSLLSSAGIVANGSVDQVGASQYFDALKKVIGSVTAHKIEVFSTPGVYVWPVPILMQLGIIKPTVYVTAGGGGTGGVPNVSASNIAISGAGGAGGTAKKVVDLTGVTSVTITVGAGGVAGAVGISTGGPGGASSFGAYCSANGGSPSTGVVAGGASNQSSAGGQGGTATGGDLNLKGGDGTSVIGIGGELAPVANGVGGTSFWGGGPKQAFFGDVPGVGGGPRALAAGSGQQPGLVGGPGMVVVEC